MKQPNVCLRSGGILKKIFPGFDNLFHTLYLMQLKIQKYARMKCKYVEILKQLFEGKPKQGGSILLVAPKPILRFQFAIF